MAKQPFPTSSLPSALDRYRVIGAKQAAEVLGFSVAHLRRLYRTGQIPDPIRLGGYKVGWSVGVIMDLIADAERDDA